jgi:hypothetical protein
LVRQMRGSECGIVAGGISRARLSSVFVCFARARMFLSGGHAPGALADGGGVVGGVEIGGGDVRSLQGGLTRTSAHTETCVCWVYRLGVGMSSLGRISLHA